MSYEEKQRAKRKWVKNVLYKIPFGYSIVGQDLGEIGFDAGWDAALKYSRQLQKKGIRLR